MAVMDYIQSAFEKVLRPKRGALTSGRGKGIGNTGVAQFEDDVRMRHSHDSASSVLCLPYATHRWWRVLPRYTDILISRPSKLRMMK